MEPVAVNALLTKTSPLTQLEKDSLRSLPFIEFMTGHGVEATAFPPANREFLGELCADMGIHSYRVRP